MEKEWKAFLVSLLSCAKEVCGFMKLGGSRKESEWWNDEVKQIVRIKRGTQLLFMGKGG